MMRDARPEGARSRVGRMETRADGSTRCGLAIPLGHPAAERLDQNGELFEVENELVYAAGPGNRELRWIEPGTGTEHPVGEDLLPSDADTAIRSSAGNLRLLPAEGGAGVRPPRDDPADRVIGFHRNAHNNRRLAILAVCAVEWETFVADARGGEATTGSSAERIANRRAPLKRRSATRRPRFARRSGPQNTAGPAPAPRGRADPWRRIPPPPA